MAVHIYRYGNICQIDLKRGRAKVHFYDDDFASWWLALPENINQRKNFKIGQQVSVLRDPLDGKNGQILYTVSSLKDPKPKWQHDPAVEGYQFADGSKVVYNNETKTLTFDADPGGEIILNCKKLTVNGDIKASGDISTDAGEVSAKGIAFSTHTHAQLGTGPVPIPTPPAP